MFKTILEQLYGWYRSKTHRQSVFVYVIIKSIWLALIKEKSEFLQLCCVYIEYHLILAWLINHESKQAADWLAKGAGSGVSTSRDMHYQIAQILNSRWR